MIRRDFFKTALAAGVAGGGSEAAEAGAGDATAMTSRRPRMMFYHDGRHPLIYMYEPPMKKEEYEAGVDELVGTPVDALMFGLADGRTVLHDTKVGELWGHNLEKWPHLIFMRAHRNAKDLIEEGNDPLRVICDRAHQKGMLLYPTLLVQQGVGEQSSDTRASDFRLNNRHLEIGAAGGVPKEHRSFNCLDFKHQEVRDERFALIQETLTRYSVDGFELQLNYVPYYFHPTGIEAGREIMTEWVAEVYRAVKESGRDRELVIRVPASIEGCESVGLDVREWLRRGIVDVLVAQNFSGPELLDPATDFRELVDIAKGTNCRIHAAIQSFVDTDRMGQASIEMIRATACNYWDQGVDGLYLAHWFGNWPYRASFYEKLREMPDPEIMAPKDKHYFVPAPTNSNPRARFEPGFVPQLPADLELNKPVQVVLGVSDELPRWDEDGRVHEVLLRFRIMNTTERDTLAFRWNGESLPEEHLRKINDTYRMRAPRYRTGIGYWFVYKLPSGHWPAKGNNTLEVTLTERDSAAVPEVYLRDVELEIKYLMGKNFNRGDGGQDLDLGEYEFTSTSYRS